MILETLVLKDYRHFVGHQQIGFAPPGPCNLTLLIGEKGTGSSTLIRLIAHLLSESQNEFFKVYDLLYGKGNPGSTASLIVKIGDRRLRVSRHNPDLPPESDIYDLGRPRGSLPEYESVPEPISSQHHLLLRICEAIWDRAGRRHDVRSAERGPLLLDDPLHCMDLHHRHHVAELFGLGGRQTIIALRPQDYRDMIDSGWTQRRRVGRIHHLIRTLGGTNIVTEDL